MHVRSRRPLQDMLTAMRLEYAGRRCRHALYPNGERHLRRRARLAQLYPPNCWPKRVRIAERCDFSLDSCAMNIRKSWCRPGDTPASYLRQLTEAGLRERFPEGTSRRRCAS